MAVSVLTGVTAVASGTKHSVALEEDGTVWAWGWNEYGQLGQGTSSGKSTVPIQVKDPTGQGVLTGIVALAGDGNYCVALRSDGTLLAWGGNGGGQLGDGTTSERDLPIVVPGLTGIQIISAGDESSSFAVDSDGLLWAWGQNRNGELGDGTSTIRKSAVPVVGISGVAGIADDGDSGGHALAVLSDGTVSSWGLNGDGQLGDGTTTTRFSPARSPTSEASNLPTLALITAWLCSRTARSGRGGTTARVSWESALPPAPSRYRWKSSLRVGTRPWWRRP